MRRFICATLLMSLCLQSTGAAAAGPEGANVSATLAQGRLDLGGATNWLVGSPLFAMILTPDRYAAMHAPRPVRVTAPHVDATKTRLTGIIRPQSNGSGQRIAGPTMRARPLLPKDAEKLTAPQRTATAAPASRLRAALPVQAPIVDRNPVVRVPALPAPAHRPSIPRATFDVTTGSTNATGTNTWWRYEEGALPGTGKYMVNVGTGNVVVQASDLVVTERGIDLEFQRTYNSMSANDTNGSYGNDDGSPAPNIFGNGWTTTYGAHLALNSAGGITVFDVDGTRYDYAPNGTGCYTPPPGMYNTLCGDGSGGGYFWTQKNGVVYYFYSPYDASSIAGYAGRLYRIFGRNQNNYIQLNYYWSGGDSSTTANLTQIVVQHTDGQALTLAFGTVNGRVLLSGVTRPDGAQVTYSYSGAHDLVSVGKIGNSAASILTEDYGYNAGDQLAWTSNPRWNLSGGADGSFTNFYYDANNRIDGVLLYGYANPTPSDDLNTPIQPGYTTGGSTVIYRTFSYPTTGETSMTDVDGHATNWFYDAVGRVTQMQRWTGASENLWLVTSSSWDATNNLTETVDARGNATDYAYDLNGNLIASALPAVTTNAGTFRPTTLYSYDLSSGVNYNNLSSVCQASYTHQLGKDWTSTPAANDSLCPTGTGAEWAVWNYTDGAEPFGRSTDTHSAIGYHRSLSHDANSQGGDYGLLTGSFGDTIGQVDGSQRTPQDAATYDQFGNAVTYSNGSQHGHVSAVFDSLNRLTRKTDADGVTVYTCYYNNGQVFYTESALQHQLDGSPSGCQSTAPAYATVSTYDADGNLVTETHHSGNQAGRTMQWYDAVDRLVEVELPQDTHDVFQNPWITRTFYDLTQGGTVSITGSASVSFRAYGNSFKRQELLVPGSNQNLSWATGQPSLNNTQFQDTGGAGYDAADRVVTRYRMLNDAPYGESISYDGNGNFAEVSQHCNGANQCGTPQYDAAGHTTSISYNDSTPSESYTYDADGNTRSATSSAFGTENYTYDAEERLTQDQEPSGGGVTSPATLSYHYYADNTNSSLDVSSPGLSQTTLFGYSYRDDGVTQQIQINLNADAAVGSSAINYSYSNAGRLLARSETGPAANGAGSTYAYDINNGSNTGVLTAETLPAAALSSFSYDAEGNVLSYNRNVYNVASGSSGTFVYTTRNEIEYDPRNTHSQAYFANGLALIGTGSNNTDHWDGRNAVLTNNGNPYTDQNGNSTGTAFSYDNAGRQTGSDQSAVDHFGNGYDITDTRQYDGENRIISGAQNDPNSRISANFNSTLTSYHWGPNGHAIQIGSTPSVYDANATTSQLSYDTLHWDGDKLLFTTNAQGAVDDIKINLPDGGTADITPLDTAFSGLTFWDSLLGMISFCHNSSGAAGTDQNSTSAFGCIKASGQTMQIPASVTTTGASNLASGVGQGKVLGTAALDRFSDGVNELQNGGDFDSLQSAATSPQTNDGNPHSPGTSRPYQIPQAGGACHPTASFCYGGSPPMQAPGGKPTEPWIPGYFYDNQSLMFGQPLVNIKIYFYAPSGAEIGVVLGDLAKLVASSREGPVGILAEGASELANADIAPGLYISSWEPKGDGAWGAGTFEERFWYKTVNGLKNFWGGADYNTTPGPDQGATKVFWIDDTGAYNSYYITPAGNQGGLGESYLQTLAQFGEANDPGVTNYTSVVVVGPTRNNTPW